MYKFMGEGILNVPTTGSGHKYHVTTGQKKEEATLPETAGWPLSFMRYLL